MSDDEYSLASTSEEETSPLVDEEEVKEVLCLVHHSPVVYWCTACKELVCAKCVTTVHKSHELEFIEEATDMKEYLLDKLKILEDEKGHEKEKIDTISTNLEHVLSNIEEFENEIKSLKHGIKEYVKEVKDYRKTLENEENVREFVQERIKMNPVEAYQEVERYSKSKVINNNHCVVAKDFDRVLSSMVCAYQVNFY